MRNRSGLANAPDFEQSSRTTSSITSCRVLSAHTGLFNVGIFASSRIHTWTFSPEMMKQLLLSKSKIHRKLPANIQREDINFFAGEIERWTDPLYMYELNNVMVTVDGVVYSRGKLVEEALMIPSHKEWFQPEYFFLQKILKSGKKLKTDKLVIHAFNAWNDGYFHWITEMLPRLNAVRNELKDAVLLLPKVCNGIFSRRYAIKRTVWPSEKVYTSPNIYEDSLAPFEIGEYQYIHPGNYITVEKIKAVSYFVLPGNYHVQSMKEVRDLYHSYFLKDAGVKKYPKKIYVSRAKSPRRKILNEEEVIQMLTRYGLQTVFFEDLSFKEQVLHAYHAKMVVSIHGAGLTNILFMQPGSKVLELTSVNTLPDLCYFSLADAVDVQYYYQFCRKEIETMTAQDANLFVDIARLEANLQQMSAS
jgi:hypothetical protein